MTREEKNSGVKKTNKFEINFDTDDDEPIGSLLKLKKSRKNKKVQLGLDCPSGKGNKHGALEEKSLLVEEDLGGMDDTLASFKKKLKGPKKELKTLGPVNISSEVVDVLKQSLNESSDDGITDSMVAERLVEMGRDEDDDRSRKRVAQERKGRAKRLKFDATKKVVENRNELNNVSMEPQGDLLEDEDHPVACQQKGSGNIASDLLEDSLSPFFRKALSAEVSTSHASLVSRKEEGTHPAGLSHYSEGVSEDFSSVEVESHHLSCLSNELLPKNQTSKESLCIDSGSAPDASNMMKYENINENNQSASCCMEEGNNLVGTLIPAQKEPSFDGCGMEEVHNGNVNNAARAYLNDSSACDGNAVSQSESVKHELKHCSSRKLYTSVQVIGESCKSVPVTGMEEETHGLGQVESSREFTNMLQEGKDGHCCSGFVEENLEPCKNHRLSDVFGVSSSQDNDNQCNSRTVLSKINLDVGHSTSTNSHHSSSPHDQFKGTPFPGNLSTTEEVPSGGSPLPTHPDDKDNCPGDSTSVPHSSSKDIKLSAVQRELRTSKKCRHGDMAYEGDAEWEILMNGRSDVADNEPPYRSRGKTDLSSNGGAVAVSVGLRARAAGPVEKVKFKEVLKRKGGLQEYIECRNWILSLWNEDVSHILPLVDCGVAETPAENEPARASLTREIYAFLDQSGYINTGVASAKCSNVNQSDEIIGEQNLEMFTEVSLADTDDKISSERGQIKISDTCINEPEGAIVITQDCCKQEGHGIVNSRTLDLPSVTGIDCLDSSHLRSDANLNLLRKSEIDVFTADSSSRLVSCSSELAEVAELVENISSAKCISNDQTGNTSEVKPNVKAGKRIIVVGGGPAGLTAARHLHRQGFAVTVLEARSRLGGRVYTDHLSLSVPVDLGASIITGVEADVDTERRPDPSSLISSQLGLELTVLNSDCPLYDIATGQKVPADLDEALEAEYNSLLDDMVWVIAQNGERAMQMSLEDGLEYALRRRRMAQLGTDVGEDELQHSSLSNSKCRIGNGVSEDSHSKEDILTPLERRVMNWHFAHLEYGCAALLKEVSLPYWNQDDVYGGFGGAHCMIKGGYSKIVESLAKDLNIHLSHIVTDISYGINESAFTNGDCCRVKVSTSNGCEFLGDAVLVTVPLGCLKYETIKFLPPLPEWKQSSVKRLGFGVLNKIVLEFAEVFWDDSVDYFGATAEETNYRGQCFMFWNVKKTVGAPVLIALLVGKAAIDGQTMSSHDHVDHAIMVLRKLFGQASVPDPVASVVTDWGRDPFSYGAYSYVAIGASGEDYDILGKPVDDCLFFAGEATCKEHPDTVGGAMMSGLREAVRIIDILSTGNDYRAEVEAMEAAQRQSDSERDEVRDVTRRLEAVEISNFRYKNSLEGDHILSREALLRDLFFNTKTTAGRLHVAKALLRLPVETFKSFAGTKEGLSTLNSWILDSMGKDGTQLLRHCVRLLVVVSTDLLAVRLSGIGKTVKEKVCVHTSRDIRAIASQLVTVWLEVFRKEKASNGGFSLLRQNANVDHSKSKSVRDLSAGKLRQYGHDAKGNVHVVPSTTNAKRMKSKLQKSEIIYDSRSESNSSRSRGSVDRRDTKMEDKNMVISEEEQAAFAAAEAARAAALAAAEAYASSEAKRSTMLQLPKIPSFHKFARREQYAQMDESELRRKWSGGVLGRQDCISEIDSRNCRVRNWDVDFPAACVKLDSSRISADNLSQRSHSNDIVCHLNLRENSGESVAVDSSIYTQAWVDASGSMEGKDYHAIERWQSQAAAAESDVFESNMHIGDEEDSNTFSMPASRKHDGLANESSLSHITINKDLKENQRGADRIKQAVVDYVATLLMPLYKARKIDREGYKSIMKKTATKVMEQATDAEKAMMVPEFLDYKRRNKIRAFVDKLIERHMVSKPVIKS